MYRANVLATFITTDLLQFQKVAPEIYKIDSTPRYNLKSVKDVCLTQILLINTKADITHKYASSYRSHLVPRTSVYPKCSVSNVAACYPVQD
jgi:hypothetical protein